MSVGRCCLHWSCDCIHRAIWKLKVKRKRAQSRQLTEPIPTSSCPVDCDLSPLLHLLKRREIAPCSAYRRAPHPSQAPDPKKMVRAKPDNDPVTFFLRPSCQVVGRPWYTAGPAGSQTHRLLPDHQRSCEVGSMTSLPGLFLGIRGQNLL